MTPRVVLVGPPGAGKSTVGQQLAGRLGTQVVDTDRLIEARAGLRIPEIFAQFGEPRFRELEEQVIAETLATAEGVVSLGGGAVLSARTRTALGPVPVVYLEISADEGLRRTRDSGRPLLNRTDRDTVYRELLEVRAPLYREVADTVVTSDGGAASRVVARILAWLDAQASPEHPAGEAGPTDSKDQP